MGRALLVVYDGPRAPWDNMALDIAMLEHVYELGAVLRIYEWALPAVSLGRKQSLEDSVDLDVARDLGLRVVRRPTGGRALYHSPRGELTYSIVLPSSHPLYGLGVVESAVRIAEGVAGALGTLGIDAAVGGYGGHGEPGENCILAAGASDVTVKGRKLSGSAQYRTGKGLLQHGSIILEKDLEGWKAIRGPGLDAVSSLSTSLREYLRRPLSRPRLVKALSEGIAEAVGLEPIHSWLPVEVFETARKLRGRVLIL